MSWFYWAAATGESALSMDGMQSFGVWESLLLPGAGSSAHCTAGWQLDGEDVHEELSTVRHRLSEIRLQALHFNVTNIVSGGFHRVIVCRHSYLGMITISD